MIWSFEHKLLAAALLGWAAVAIASLIAGPPLGHDEAAFALLARGDAPDWLYRSRGVVALGELGVALGGADWQLRLPGAVLGLALVPAVYLVGRAAYSPRIGAWAAAVIAGAYPMLSRNADLLGDVPATAFVLIGVALLVELADGARWRVVLAAPAFAAGFYLRYASAPVIALAGVAALALCWRPIRARPAPVVAAAALFALLLVPHLAASLDQTGALLGVLRTSAGVPRRAYVGEGLISYVTVEPFTYYGALVAPLLVAGVLGLPRAPRRAWLLAIVAFGQLIALGLQSHAQPRYVFVASALLGVLGVATVARWPRPRLALAAVALAGLAAAVAVVVTNRTITRNRAPLLAAAAAVHRSPGCIVVGGTGPQLAWYTGCVAVPLDWDDAKVTDPTIDRFLISTPYRAFDGPAYAAAHHLTATALPTSDPRARVWRLR